ncbi:late cornified envelope-like proline-rich protein 1 [Copidosoma floridanum]|uniref:late cornified envelope-like proline-rich protein 1 n=1 Tax=Copidosoma floridanum TaxID=29053 RepID=UPI0006C9AB3E|nr:late cornified envelope-like proline-rich protein 1 [Copidosoma floridanum]
MSVTVKCVKKPDPECKVVINRSNCWPPCPSPAALCSPCPQTSCTPCCPPCPTTALVRCAVVQGGVLWQGIASVPCSPCCPPAACCYYCPD